MRKGETATAFCFCALLTRQDILSLPVPTDEFGNSALWLFIYLLIFGVFLFLFF